MRDGRNGLVVPAGDAAALAGAIAPARRRRAAARAPGGGGSRGRAGLHPRRLGRGLRERAAQPRSFPGGALVACVACPRPGSPSSRPAAALLAALADRADALATEREREQHEQDPRRLQRRQDPQRLQPAGLRPGAQADAARTLRVRRLPGPDPQSATAPPPADARRGGTGGGARRLGRHGDRAAHAGRAARSGKRPPPRRARRSGSAEKRSIRGSSTSTSPRRSARCRPRCSRCSPSCSSARC